MRSERGMPRMDSDGWQVIRRTPVVERLAVHPPLAPLTLCEGGKIPRFARNDRRCARNDGALRERWQTTSPLRSSVRGRDAKRAGDALVAKRTDAACGTPSSASP